MATYDETFVCTPLAESVSGTKLRIAVLVTPRLGSDTGEPAALDNWPDVRDWPDLAPTWTVRIARGGTAVELPGTEVGAPYDSAAWHAMFPGTQETTPYVPEDRSKAPIRSYPVAAARDAVRDLHVRTLKAARTDFPALAALRADPTFAALLAATDPAVEDEACAMQATDPVPDAGLNLRHAFALAGCFHGARPHSAPQAPTVTSVDPGTGPSTGGTLVIVTGTNLTGAQSVRFGAAEATAVQVLSDTQVSCVSPPGTAGSLVAVTVATPGGTTVPKPSNNFSDKFRYVFPPPVVTALTPATGPTQGGTTVTVDGANFVGTVTVAFVNSDGRSAAATDVVVVSAGRLTCRSPEEPDFPSPLPSPVPPDLRKYVVRVTADGRPSPTAPAPDGSNVFTYFTPGPK